MKSFLTRNHRLVFYGLWALLGIIQAGLTELWDDEAYYWVYGQYLDWGYFDHPPMTGLLIKMGYGIFPNELGVRLFPLLLNVFSLLIIERLTSKKNPLLFYLIAMSIAVLQLAGFLAVPDIPLIFFTALFFLCYRQFINRSNLWNTVLLGIAMALLMYSKYHAALIILFTLLSNLKLFTKYQAYLAVLISLVLFTPHLWWQQQHDWVSIRYHLFESNVNPYKVSYTIEYVIGQLLLPGPIAGFILLPAAFMYKPTNPTEKALKFNMIGIYIFFLLSSFRGRVEGNWTSPALVGLLILSHQYLVTHLKLQKLLFRLLPISLLLVLFARIVMIVDILPVNAVKERFHSWKKWPTEMRQLTHNLPIVFSNSYQRASKYWFYSGQMTLSLNAYTERINNYNLWPIEDSMLGKLVYFLDKYGLERFPDSLKTPIGWVGYKYDSNFISLGKIKIATKERKVTVATNREFILHCSFSMPQQYWDFIQRNNQLNDTVRIGIFQNNQLVKEIFPDLTAKEMITVNHKEILFNPAVPVGKYFLRFAINCGNRYPVHVSEKIEMIVE